METLQLPGRRYSINSDSSGIYWEDDRNIIKFWRSETIDKILFELFRLMYFFTLGKKCAFFFTVTGHKGNVRPRNYTQNVNSYDRKWCTVLSGGNVNKRSASTPVIVFCFYFKCRSNHYEFFLYVLSVRFPAFQGNIFMILSHWSPPPSFFVWMMSLDKAKLLF